MKNRLILSFLFIVLVYFVIIFFSDPLKLIKAFSKVGFIHIFIAFLFILLSGVMEYFKWVYLLRAGKINISLKKSFFIFAVGECLSFLPAKSGELVRPVLLKKQGHSYKKSMPVLFMFNFSLLVIVIISCIPALFIFDYNICFFLFSLLIILLFFSLHFYKFYLRVFSFLKKKLKIKIFNDLINIFKGSRNLLTFEKLSFMFIQSLLYQIFIGFAFYAIISNFKLEVPFLVAFSIFNLSIILGLLSMLPGGAGVMEGSSLFLLGLYMNSSSAVAVIIIMNFFMLWLPMIVGFLIYLAHLFLGKKVYKSV
ncbi:MAG: lysylphosphatidylglycerol synthase transmembrane domain-containing protein [Nanobdellota archaeon]